MPGWPPEVLGRLPSRRRASATMAAGCTPHFSSSGLTMPSFSSASEISRCSGNITWLSPDSASAWDCCKASCAFCVSLSNRNIVLSPNLSLNAKGAGGRDGDPPALKLPFLVGHALACQHLWWGRFQPANARLVRQVSTCQRPLAGGFLGQLRQPPHLPAP